MATARGTPRFTPAARLSLCASPAPRAEGPAPLAPPPHTSACLLPASLRKQKGTWQKPKGEERSAKAPLPGRPSFTANSSSPVLGPLKLPAKVLSSKSLIKATTDPTRGVSRFIVTIPLGWRRGWRGAGAGCISQQNVYVSVNPVAAPPPPSMSPVPTRVPCPLAAAPAANRGLSSGSSYSDISPLLSLPKQESMQVTVLTSVQTPADI